MKASSNPTSAARATAGRVAKDRPARAARAAAGALQEAGAALTFGLRTAAPQAAKLAGNAFFARGDVLGLHLSALHAVKLVGSALFTRSEGPR